MRDNLEVNAVKGLQGEIFIPGDKSISHRSVMFSSLGDKAVTIKNFLNEMTYDLNMSEMEKVVEKYQIILINYVKDCRFKFSKRNDGKEFFLA